MILKVYIDDFGEEIYREIISTNSNIKREKVVPETPDCLVEYFKQCSLPTC